jgi:hypothetical protein
MRHEPSGSRPPIQQTAGRRCPSCQTVRSVDEFPIAAGAHAGCCGSCRRRRAAVARRHRQRTLRRVARRAEAGYRALVAELQGGGGDAA